MKIIKGVVSIAVVASLGIAGLAATAHADDTNSPDPTPVDLVASAEEAVESLDAETAETVVSTVEELAIMPEIADNTSDNTIVSGDGSTITTDGGNTVEVPATADDPVQVTTSNGEVVAIALPIPAGTEAVVVDGVSVYPTEHGAITQLATDGGGTQTIITLNGPDAPTAYPVQITVDNGGSLALQPDGSVAVISPDGTSSSGLATPWAKDANDNQIPTWFTVDGNTVTQHIDTTSVTAWPVTADPFWSVFGSYMKCILGIGVPLGVAWFFVGALGTATAWSALVSIGSSGPRAGTWPGWFGAARWYATGVWNSCGKFLRS